MDNQNEECQGPRIDQKDMSTPFLEDQLEHGDQQNRNFGHRKNDGVDMTAHMGLRGIATLWIVIFHCCFYNEMNLNIQGSALMSLFFLLSGFSLAVIYGERAMPSLDTEHEGFQWKHFYQNRLARIMPLFYLSNAIGFGTVFTGFGTFSPSSPKYMLVFWIAGVISGSYTWTLFSLGAGFDGPGWTISTLLAFYLLFPVWCRKIQQHICFAQSRFGYGKWLFWLNILQLVLGYGVFFLTAGNFYLATMVPYTRFPVFIMGVVAGLECKNKDFSEDMPHYCLCSSPSAEIGDADGHAANPISKIWARRVNFASIVWAVIFLYYCIYDSLAQNKLVSSDEILFLEFVTGGAVHLQFFGVPLLLVMIVGMTRDQGHSILSKFCRHKWSIWFGNISLGIYLIHEVLIEYFHAIYFGHQVYDEDSPKAGFQKSGFSLSENKELGSSMPWWGVVVVFPLSLFCGWLLNCVVEKPLRKALSVRK